MGPAPAYRIELVGTRNNSRRGVAFIEGHEELISKGQFEGQVANDLVRRQILSRMERWIEQANRPADPEKFHGWDSSQHGGRHKMCFVFKYRNSKVSVRLYGFLCNPVPQDQRFQLFVPVMLTDKRGDDTKKAILDRIAALSRDPSIVECLATYRHR